VPVDATAYAHRDERFLVEYVAVIDPEAATADGSSLKYETEFIFEERDGKTLMTMIQSGLPPSFATSIGPACRTLSPALSRRSRSLPAACASWTG
jgi:hypothetical protein